MTRKILIINLLFLSPFICSAQDDINDLLAAGVQDAELFASDYLLPATDGLAYSMNNGWFNNAKAPKRFGFELSLVGNVSLINDEKKSFEMRVSDYQNIRFADNSPSKTVATALGQNDPDITVLVTYDDPIFGDQEIELTLPTGLGSENINLIPTAFLQASFSPFKGTQLKARYFPKVDTQDTEVGLYGLGIQQEFTSWLPADKIWPVAISGLIAYTHLDGSYDFTDAKLVEGENQRIETNVNTMLYQLIVGTRLKVINFYGGLGYISGKSETNLLGTYVVNNDILFADAIIDPFSIDEKISGTRATIGTHLKLGFFALNADYTFAEFDSASLALSVSF